MEVILREDVPHLGTIGDIVKVRPGYARNYLLPRGLATVADKRNLRALEHERRLVDEKRRRALSAAEALATAARRGAHRDHRARRRGGQAVRLGDQHRHRARARRAGPDSRAAAHPPRRADQDARRAHGCRSPSPAGVPCELTVTVAPIAEE